MKNKQLKRLGKILFSLTLIFSSIGITNTHVADAKKALLRVLQQNQVANLPAANRMQNQVLKHLAINLLLTQVLKTLKELTTKTIIVIIIKVTKSNIQSI